MCTTYVYHLFFKLYKTIISLFLFQQIILQGVAGSSFQGDIALDDLQLIDGNCPSDLPFECDFDDDSICGFTNDETEKHKWIRHKGLLKFLQKKMNFDNRIF